MKESYEEEIADHFGLNPDAGFGDKSGVATERGTGRPAIELRNPNFRVPTLVLSGGRQHVAPRKRRAVQRHGGVAEPAHVWKLQTREPGDLVGIHTEHHRC